METDTGQLPAESLKELHAYAKLLFLRDGRQIEDKTSYRDCEGRRSPDLSESDGVSFENVALGDLDINHLRREFLDRLSEVVSSTKGGHHVVASHMFYWPDQIKVFLAINTGFTKGDGMSKFLDNLCTALKAVAAVSESQTERHMDSLWATLIHHQSPRVNAEIVNLRRILKKFHHLLPQGSSPLSVCDIVLPDFGEIVLDFEAGLKLLAELLFNDIGSNLQRHSNLVGLSNALFRTFPVEHFQTLGRAGEKLHQAIGFLGRLQIAFRILVAAAKQISGFENLSLIPVVGLKTRKTPLSHEWSLAKTFHALNLQLSDTSIGTLKIPSSSKVGWTKTKLLTNFSRLKSPTGKAHAEIQLIIFILSHPDEVAHGERFNYIGCSKYSCLLCSKFLYLFQALRTRGCHGKLYNHSWTVPRDHELGSAEQIMLSEVISKFTSWMQTELIASKTPLVQGRQAAKESTIGDSLTAILGTSQDGQQQSYTISEHLHRQRAQNSHIKTESEKYMLRITLNSPLVPMEYENSLTVGDGDGQESLAKSAVKLCASCFDVETTRRCSHCGGSLICSTFCERNMPLSHLLKCNLRQVTSADYLYADVLADELPTDPQLRQDYWFDRCQNKTEESNLFGVFAGLLHYHPRHIMREGLHLWRSDQRGNPYMVSKIVEKFEELPESKRGGYFPWFRKYRTRFELPDCHRSIPRAPCHTEQIHNIKARARKYLSPEDQHKDIQDLSPFAKMHCSLFYAMVSDKSHPPPINRDYCHWFDFGFVVSHDQYEEGRLGSMYHTMLFGHNSHTERTPGIESLNTRESPDRSTSTCSFEEFWKAWEAGKLMTLFDRCWPPSPTERTFDLADRNLLERLRMFLEADKPRPSVWSLRHFLAIEGVSVESATSEIALASRDYGFSEQLDARTIMELKNFYIELLKKAEPSAINHERMEGNLMRFAEGHVECITLGVREVLQSLLWPC